MLTAFVLATNMNETDFEYLAVIGILVKYTL